MDYSKFGKGITLSRGLPADDAPSWDEFDQQLQQSAPTIGAEQQVQTPTFNDDASLGEAERVQQAIQADIARRDFQPNENLPQGKGLFEDGYPFQQTIQEMMMGAHPLVAPSLARMRNDNGELEVGRAVDYGQTAGTSATFGLSSPLNALVEASYDTLMGDGTFVENYKAERSEGRQQRYERELRMDEMDRLEAEFLGAAAGGPMRVGKMLDDIADGGQHLMGFFKRLRNQGGLGMFEGMAYDIALNGDDANMLGSGAAGLAAGMGGQAVLGEGMPRLVRWIAGGGDMGTLNTGDILFQTGSENAPMSPKKIPGIVQDLKYGDNTGPMMAADGSVVDEAYPRSILDVDIEGFAPGELSAKIADAIPGIEFPIGAGPNSRSSTLKRNALDEAAATVAASRRYLDARVRGTVNRALGGPQGDITTYSNFLETEPLLAGPRKAYKLAFEGPNGQKPVDYDTYVLPELEKAWEKVYGAVPASTGGQATKEWNDAIKGVLAPKHRTHRGAAMANPSFNDKRELQPHGVLTINELHEARKDIARKMRAGVFVNGDTVSREQAKANRLMVETIDNMIADLSGFDSKARADFAKVMQQRDDFEYGQQIAAKMGRWESDDSKSVFEYLDDDISSLDARSEAVRAGFMSKYSDRLYTAPMTTLRSTFGEGVDNQTLPLWDARPKNELILRKILGDESADRLKAVTHHWKPKDDGLAAIEDSLKAKMDNPRAVRGAESKMDKFYQANMMLNPNSSIGLGQPTGQGALARALTARGPATAQSLSDFLSMTDDKAGKRLRQIYDAWMSPTSAPMGLVSAAMTANDKAPYDAEADSQLGPLSSAADLTKNLMEGLLK